MTTPIGLLKIPLQEFRPTEVRHLCLSPSGVHLSAVLANRTLQLLDASLLSLHKSVRLQEDVEPIGTFWAHHALLGVVTLEGFVFLFVLHNLAVPLQKVFVGCQGVLSFRFAFFDGTRDAQNMEFLAIGGGDGSLHLFEAPLPSQDVTETDVLRLRSITHCPAAPPAECSACLPDPLGRWVVGAWANGTIRKATFGKQTSGSWTAEVGKSVPVLCLEVFADQLLAAGAADGRVHVLDLRFGVSVQILQGFSTAQVTCLALDAPHGLLYWSGFDSRVFAAKFDPAAGAFQVVGQNRGQTHEVNALVVAGDRLLSAGRTSDFCVFRIGGQGFLERENQSKRHVQQSLENLLFHCAEGRLGLIYGGSVFLARFDGQSDAHPTPTLEFQVARDSPPSTASFLAKYGLLCLADRPSATVSIYNTATGAISATLPYAATKSFASRHFFWLAGDAERGLTRVDSRGDTRRIHSSPSLPTSVLQDPDVLEVSENEEALLIGNVLSKQLWQVNMKDSQARDLSAVAKLPGARFFCFQGSTTRVLFVADGRISVFHPSKQTSFVLAEGLPAQVPGKAFKGLSFAGPSKKIVCLWTDYELILVDTSSARKSVQKLSAPALAVGSLRPDQLLRLHVDWKSAAALLEAPVFTKRFAARRTN